MKYHFHEERQVKEVATFIVEADSLEKACQEYAKRRIEGDPPEDSEGVIQDHELVYVGYECGALHNCDLDVARRYVDETYQAWEADQIAAGKEERRRRRKDKAKADAAHLDYLEDQAKLERDQGPIEVDPDMAELDRLLPCEEKKDAADSSSRSTGMKPKSFAKGKKEKS